MKTKLNLIVGILFFTSHYVNAATPPNIGDPYKYVWDGDLNLFAFNGKNFEKINTKRIKSDDKMR